MLMLGPKNSTRCTWVRLLNSFCLVPDRTHGVPGILPAELGHNLWDLSDLSEDKLQPSPTGGSLSLTEEVLQLSSGPGRSDDNRGGSGEVRGKPSETHLKHGLQVGILATSAQKPSLRSSLALKAVSKLPHIVRAELTESDCPTVTVHLPLANVSLVMPLVTELKLREIVLWMAALKMHKADSPWEAGAGMIAAGPDVLLLEAPLDVTLMGKSLEAFKHLTLVANDCRAFKDSMHSC